MRTDQRAGTTPPAAREERLNRVLGVRQLAANIVNHTVGSGIFVLPAVVALQLGPAALTAYVACAVVVGLVALCFAECGSRVSASGGPQAYIETAFGPLAGALTGAFNYVSIVGAGAAVANVFALSLGGLWAPLEAPAARAALILLLLGGLGWLNVRGVSQGARLVELATAAKLAPLALLAIVGLFAVDPANFAGFGIPAPAALGAATLALVFAYTGPESALTPSGEVRNPARTVPRALALGLLVIVALYGALHVVAQGVLGAALAGEQKAPLAAAARAIAGAPGGQLILLGATISTFGYMASNVLSGPRALYSLGRDGTLPAAFAAVHARFRTPHVAILAHVALAAVLAVFGAFGPLALVSAVATLMMYVGCAAAVLELRRRDVRTDGAPFVVPGGPVIPLASLAVTLWLLSNATRAEWTAMGAVAAAVVAAWLVRRARRTA
jgi:amino acid transporter